MCIRDSGGSGLLGCDLLGDLLGRNGLLGRDLLHGDLLRDLLRRTRLLRRALLPGHLLHCNLLHGDLLHCGFLGSSGLLDRGLLDGSLRRSGSPAGGSSLGELAWVCDHLAELGAGLELRDGGLLDLDARAGARVATGPCRAHYLFERTEAGDADLAALGDLADDDVEHGLDRIGRSLLAAKTTLEGFDQLSLVHVFPSRGIFAEPLARRLGGRANARLVNDVRATNTRRPQPRVLESLCRNAFGSFHILQEGMLPAMSGVATS